MAIKIQKLYKLTIFPGIVFIIRYAHNLHLLALTASVDKQVKQVKSIYLNKENPNSKFSSILSSDVSVEEVCVRA